MKQINEIQDLMEQQNYTEAINLIERLKKAEKESNLNYNLTHRLYQLDSNSRSLYNQQVILNIVKNLTIKYKTITFRKLNEILKAKEDLMLTDDILRREIELLILRNLLPCKIDNDKIILKRI